MRNPHPVLELQLQLAMLGYPAWRSRRIVREASEHYSDLLRSARTGGLSEEEATAEAARLFGEPKALAEQHAEVLRRSTFLGRLPAVFSLFVFPILTGYIFSYTALLVSSIPTGIWMALTIHVQPGSGGFRAMMPDMMVEMILIMATISNVLQGLAWLWFYRRLQNAGLSLKQRTIVCGVLTYASLCSWWSLPTVILMRNSPTLHGLGEQALSRMLYPHWGSAGAAAIPLLAGVLMYLWQRRQVEQLIQGVHYA